MTQSPDTQSLADALAAFRATRSAYQSTSDQALTQLLTSLAEEMLALRSRPRALAAPPAPTADAAVLQAQLAALQATCEAQQSELAQLRTLVTQLQLASPLRLPTRRRAAIVSLPRVMRPIDYWEQHIPDYGDATTEADLAAARTRPRVRPEDVVLTAEDRARQMRRPRSVLLLSEAIRVVVVVLGALALLYLGLAFLIWLF